MHLAGTIAPNARSLRHHTKVSRDTLKGEIEVRLPPRIRGDVPTIVRAMKALLYFHHRIVGGPLGLTGCFAGRGNMYIARFSYAVLPINRLRAIDFIQREVDAARRKQLTARLLVPLTRGPGRAALQFEIELASLDQFEQFRDRGMESEQETGSWMRAFSEILLSPPEVELLKVQATRAP
jgi:hypothetical protein